MKYFDRNNEKLIYFIENKTNNNFWDNLWLKNRNDLRNEILIFNPKSLVGKISRRFLNPKDGPILEGGCGLGNKVYTLKRLKFNVIGIDNARQTINKLKKDVPEIYVEYGDVRRLTFHDNYFAGYWSLGVIEHFYEGYLDVATEMHRVIKPTGFLFLTFPYMSPFRRFKAKANLYRIFNNSYYQLHKNPVNFYQYILNSENVIKTFENLGFTLKYRAPFSGIKGFKDEIFVSKFFIIKFLDLLNKKNKPKYIHFIQRFIDKFLLKFAGHIMLLVFQKS